MCNLSSYFIFNTCRITTIKLSACKELVLALLNIISQVVFIGLYHSPWAVIVHIIYKLIHVHIQLLAACVPLHGHLGIHVNTIRHYISNRY